MYSQQTNEKPIIVLRLWIFKFIRNDRDEFAVCVEGYRKKDFAEKDLENWRSTEVKERCDSNLLRTASDSKYVLHGVIDHDSAYALGYPRTLIERFKDGFPPDWRELLCDYYNAVVKPNKFNTSQKIFSSLLSSIFLDKSKYSHANEHRKSLFEKVLSGRESSVEEPSSSIANNGRRENRALIKEKIVEEDDEASKSSASSSISSRSKHTSREFLATFGTPFSTPSYHIKSGTPKYPKPNRADEVSSTTTTTTRKNDSKMEVVGAQHLYGNKSQDDTLFKLPLLPVQRRRAKPIELYSWTIRFSANYLGESKLFPNFAFVIIGFRPDKNMDWSTSCIVAVEGNCLVRTVTGDYKLIGPINTMIATQQGFPKEFIAQFLNGFPKDWHRILSVFFNTYIEPQILPQQSLTISEICNDDEAAVNVQRGDFSRSIRSGSSDETTSDSNDSNSDEDSLLERDYQFRKEKRKFTKNHNSKKSIHYWTDTPYFPVNKKKGDQKSEQRGSRSPAFQKKRIKLGTNVSGSLNTSLLRTRSGRTTKPRLATWTGQRIVYNVRGSPIKTVGIITDSVYSTSTSDTSSLSVGHEKTSREIGRNRSWRLSLPKAPANKIGLVAYSDSSESFSSESNDDGSQGTGRRLSLTPPVTPFYGRRGLKVTRSRVVRSSSPEGDNKTIKRHHRKLYKRQARTRKKAAHKQKSKPKKVASLTSKTVQVKENEGRDGVEEAVPIVSFSDVESDNGAVSNKKGIDSVPAGVTKKARISKPRKWTENDNTRLKLAVQALNPNSEEDWESVATTMRTRTARECRKQALEILKLKITSATDQKAEVSNQVVDALQKTRVGTLAYQIQADRFTQQYLRGGDGSDFFEETMDEGPSRRKVAVMPSVTTFDSDDSLLAVLRTPTPRPVRRNNRRKKLTFRESSSFDSPKKRSPRISEVLFKLNPDDEAYREQQLRYAHKMMKIKRNYLNASHANITRSSALTNYTLNLPAVESQHNDSGKESEDEYFEEESD